MDGRGETGDPRADGRRGLGGRNPARAGDTTGRHTDERLPRAASQVARSRRRRRRRTRLAALAKHEQDAEGRNFDVFSALRDRFHVFENPRSAHNEGLAFDATTKDRDYDAARERMRSYLNKLGFKEGDLQGRSGDYATEPGTRDHLHAQFNSREASERYYQTVTGKPDRYASLHDRQPMQGQHDLAKHGEALREMFGRRIDRSLGQEVRRDPGALLRAADQRQAAVAATTHKVQGEASLRIKLASGLVPDNGAKNKGNLFREIRLDRAPVPLASTMG